MEGVEKFFGKIVKDAKSAASSSSSSLSDFADNLEKRAAAAAAANNNSTSYDSSRILVNRPPSGVSAWTCSKLCAFFFVAGVFVGYTLKRRVRSWASKLLRRIKDD